MISMYDALRVAAADNSMGRLWHDRQVHGPVRLERSRSRQVVDDEDIPEIRGAVDSVCQLLTEHRLSCISITFRGVESAYRILQLPSPTATCGV
jgi:hypothetical protein